MLFSLSVNGNNREVKCYLESDNWIVQNLNNALETWNSKLSEIWQLLTQSPETFKGGDIWSVMLTIHDALKGIGYGLLVLFFAISVVKTCSSYLDVKKPEHAVKLFIRFALAKGAVGYGLELMMALFSVIQGMVSTIMQNSGFGGDSDVIELPAEMVEKIESVGLLDSIPLWIVTLLGSLFITVLSFIMILTVYGRMFKLYMYTAIAPIPIATFAGEPTQNIGKNFVRSYAGVCMEGAIIALACIIFSVFAASPPAIADSSLSAVNIVWNYVAAAHNHLSVQYQYSNHHVTSELSHSHTEAHRHPLSISHLDVSLNYICHPAWDVPLGQTGLLSGYPVSGSHPV